MQLTDPGDYQLTCKPGMVGEGISQPLTVTGEAIDVVEGDEAAGEAVDGYLSYVRNQTQTLQEQTKDFTAAIEEGDIDKDKELFPIVRTPYERIEPVGRNSRARRWAVKTNSTNFRSTSTTAPPGR